MSYKDFKLENIIQLPKNWRDLPSFKYHSGEELTRENWISLYRKYQQETVKPWIIELNNKYGKKQISDFRKLDAHDNIRIEDGGVINLFCGFYLSAVSGECTKELNYIPISVPIFYLVETINVLPYMIQAQNDEKNISLSEIMNTSNKAEINAFGIILPPGEQIMMYTVERVCMPNTYIGQATTKSSIGRRGLDSVATAGTFNKGWVGIPLLEINNRNAQSDILIEIGAPVAQFYLIDSSHSKGKYKGEFQNQLPKIN